MPNIDQKAFLEVPVIHAKYGRGVITELADSTIIVEFRGEHKRFIFPDIFDGYLRFEQGTDEKKLSEMLECAKHQQEKNARLASKRHSSVSSYSQQAALEHGLEAEIAAAIALFDDFKLTQESKDELAGYFRYRARMLPSHKAVHYNFFVHSVSKDISRRFTALFSNVCHYFDPLMGKSKGGLKGDYQTRRDEPMPSKHDTFLKYVDTTYLPESTILKGPPDGLAEKEMVIVNCSASWYDADQRSEDAGQKKRAWEDFVTSFCEWRPEVCKVLCVPEDLAQSRFRNDEHIYFRVFPHHIFFDKFSPAEIHDNMISELSGKGFRLSRSFIEELEHYISAVYSNTELQGLVFIEDLTNRIASNYYAGIQDDMRLDASHVPPYRKGPSQTTPLDELVGLDNIKKRLADFKALMRFRRQGEEQGLRLEDMQLHMVFTGNPGTGKTTVARIVADILFDLGVISKNKVVEVTKRDLCAEYVGQTAIKTGKVIEKAVGGVLFVDEAYALASAPGSLDYGKEALETIMTAMENQRRELVVIFAGYEDEMRGFMESNPGIQSRIGYMFHFDDYSAAELHEIFCRQLDNQGFLRTHSADESAKLLWGKNAGVKNAGNGRLVRKVVQEVIVKHAARITEMESPSAKDYKTITDADVPSLQEVSEWLMSDEKKRAIGFATT